MNEQSFNVRRFCKQISAHESNLSLDGNVSPRRGAHRVHDRSFGIF